MTEQSIFLAALEIADPAQRAAYVEQSCAADPVLRRQVEALLAAHQRSGAFLDVPALQQMAAGDAADPRSHGETCAEPRAAEEGINLAFLQPSTRPGALGRLGHYEVLEVLGQGGFGIVFKAFDEKLQRLVAIKAMSPQLAATSPPRKRFLREARAAAAIRHENVVAIYAVEEQPIPYLVMEYIAGQTLQQKLDQHGPLDVRDVVQIGLQIASGLEAAHATGLIHRDIKPGNILLEQGRDRVKLTDFGLARASDDASLTQSGVIAGTPLYMSPEQAHGSEMDQRSDLFSLGSVLYAMCSGRPPFRAATTLAVLKRVAEDEPRPIREIIPEVPDWLSAIIAKLHAKKPEDRFASAQEVAGLLARCLAEWQQHGQVKATDGILPWLTKPTSAAEKAVPDEGARSPRQAVAAAARRPARSGGGRWVAAAALFLAVLGGLSLTEAAGVTKIRGTIIRLFSPDGTLVVEVDDPGVSVSIDGEEMVITGAGAKEIRLKPGQYKVLASKDGKPVMQELVTVTKNGRQVVNVRREAGAPAKAAAPVDDAWLQSVAALSTAKQVEAVAKKLRELNPDFDGQLKHAAEGNMVTQVAMSAKGVTDLSPLRAFRGLKQLDCQGLHQKGAVLTDLSPLSDLKLVKLNCANTNVVDLTPLKNMSLEELNCMATRVVDLSPLKGMPLKSLACGAARVTDLSPLKGMPLQILDCGYSGVADLAPLTGMELTELGLFRSRVSDLSPLKGMKLKRLECTDTLVSDLSPLKDMPLRELDCDFKPERDTEILRSIKTLERINYKTAAEFWKDVGRNKSAEIPDPDRRATEFLLSQARNAKDAVQVNDVEPWLREAKDLPVQPFRLTGVTVVWGSKLTDADLEHFKGCKHLKTLILCGTEVTKKGLANFKDCGELRNLTLVDGAFDDTALELFKDRAPQLTHLDLRGNVSDAGLANFQATTELAIVGLNYTRLSDKGLAFLKNNKKLKELGLRSTAVSDAGLEPLARMPCLQSISLLKTKVTEAGVKKLAAALPDCRIEWDGGVIEPKKAAADPDRRAAEWVLSIGGTISIKQNGQERQIGAAGDLPKGPFELTVVFLLHNPKASDVALANFAGCKSLTQLTLHATPVSDGGLAHFQDCKSLTRLDLGSTQVSDAGIRYFKDCKNLTVLQLNETRVTDEGLAFFKDCKEFIELHLSNTKTGDAALAQLKDCRDLKVLNLTLTNVTDAGLAHLRECSALSHLILDGVKVGDDGIASLRHCKNLIHLSLQGAKVSDAGLARFKEFSRLQSLGLGGTQVGDSGLARLKDCEKLLQLDLKGTKVSDAGLVHLKYCKDLKALSLFGTEVTDAGVVHLKDCKNLASVDFQGTKITDAGLIHLKECKNLTDLWIIGTQVDGSGLMHLNECTKLKYLRLGKTKVTAARFEELKKAFPKCHIESDYGTYVPGIDQGE